MFNIVTNGYGSSFTILTVKNNILEKKSINEYGNFKIKNEIGFYNYLLNNNYNWKIPEIYLLSLTQINMKYYTTYTVLYSIFYTLSIEKQNILIQNIIYLLNDLHSFEKISIDKEEFAKHIKLETYDKIIIRTRDIQNILIEYNYIIYVNSIELLSFDKILEYINIYIDNYIQNLNEYKFSIIHGDCQFSNILYDNKTDDIIFIDPRGYFGNMKLYGLKEYDIAKVYFALSGYDYFDKLEVNNLIIKDNNNLIIDDFSINLDFLGKIDIISVLVISIWLGNAHAFKHNPMKTAMSHFYALYLGTLLFRE